MTLADLLPRRRAVVVAAPVETVADIPRLVFAEMLYARPASVHRHSHDTFTACGLAVWPFWTVEAAKVQGLDPAWCPVCWPGGRCHLPGCGLPAGLDVECPAHSRQGMDVECWAGWAA